MVGGVSEEWHCAHAYAFGLAGVLPGAADMSLDTDRSCAVAATIERRRNFHCAGQTDAGRFKELARHVRPISDALFQGQEESAFSVASNIHVALIDMGSIIVRWPRWMLARSCISSMHQRRQEACLLPAGASGQTCSVGLCSILAGKWCEPDWHS